MAEIVATNVDASESHKGDRLQRRPLVPKFLKNFWKYIEQLSYTLYTPLKPPFKHPWITLDTIYKL